MFNLFKKTNNKDELLLKTASLLIHTAKIDGSYSDNERDIRDYKLGVKKFYLPYRMFKFFRYRYLYRLYWSVKN